MRFSADGQCGNTLLRCLQACKKTHLADQTPFEFYFVDSWFDGLYQNESQLAKVSTIYSVVSLILCALGLYGMTALLLGQRKKEIGIRKVLGASVSQILGLISKDFIKLIGLAMIVSAPLTWYALSGWLDEFAYRIDFPWWLILVAGLLVMFIAFLTITAQSARAAIANPVDAIRDE